MTVGATNVITPVLATTKVIALFFAGVTGETRLRDFFRRLVLKRNDLGGIAFGNVILARTVTSLATRYLIFPTGNIGELRMRRVRKSLELILVTILAGVAADVITRVVFSGYD